MRKLATIQKIASIFPIPNAEAIERAQILGWEVVVKKSEFKVGDLCVYCEIDSILPEKPEFEFLRQSKFRIRTIKLRGQISQGIAFPLSILPAKALIKEDEDVTDILGITKHEPYQSEIRTQKQRGKFVFPDWFPQFIRRFLVKKFPKIAENICRILPGVTIAKTWPAFFPKTDETRVQVLQDVLSKYVGTKCYITEKVDGSSISVYRKSGKFGVCSRNLDIDKDPTNKFWKAVIDANIEQKLNRITEGDIVLQGELLGDGVQGNKYKLHGNMIMWYNVWNVKERKYYDYRELVAILDLLGVSMVPVLNYNYELSAIIPDLVEMSKGESELTKGVLREGIVIRPLIETIDFEFSKKLPSGRISFKVVNPEFLLKYGE